jgi:hypothetical protein
MRSLRRAPVRDPRHAQRASAGSGPGRGRAGKTLIAAELARRLPAEGFEALLTCFNRPLAEFLDQTVGRLERIRVSTFHRLSERLGLAAGA